MHLQKKRWTALPRQALNIRNALRLDFTKYFVGIMMLQKDPTKLIVPTQSIIPDLIGGFNPSETYYIVKMDIFPKWGWRWKTVWNHHLMTLLIISLSHHWVVQTINRKIIAKRLILTTLLQLRTLSAPPILESINFAGHAPTVIYLTLWLPEKGY